jgi:hypothetical protein
MKFVNYLNQLENHLPIYIKNNDFTIFESNFEHQSKMH